jgi:uncharacterized protein DUF6770
MKTLFTRIYRTCIIITMLMSFGVSIFAQSKRLENVLKVELKNLAPIMQGSMVKGYYMFYNTDSKSKKVSTYTTKIFDQNLNVVGTHNIEGSNDLYLTDVVYNNAALLLKLLDPKKKEITIIQIDNKANEIYKSKRKASQVEMGVVYLQKSQFSQIPTIYPIKNTGFLELRTVQKMMKIGYSVEFHPTNTSLKNWSISSDPKSKEYESSSFIYGDDNIFLLGISGHKTIKPRIYSFNSTTGEKIGELKFDNSKYDATVLRISKVGNEKEVVVVGYYYPKGSDFMNTPSIGIFISIVSYSGNITSQNYFSWSEDISKLVDNHGFIKDVGLYIQDFVSDESGNIFIVAESFQQHTSGDVTNAIIKDLVILETNNKLELKGAEIFKKNESKVDCQRVDNSFSMLACLFASDSLDFQFLQKSKDGSMFAICYIDYDEDANKYNLGSIIYSDGQYSVDKFELLKANEKKWVKVMTSKIGNVMIVEYDEKEKTLDMRIEKLNY